MDYKIDVTDASNIVAGDKVVNMLSVVKTDSTGSILDVDGNDETAKTGLIKKSDMTALNALLDTETTAVSGKVNVDAYTAAIGVKVKKVDAVSKTQLAELTTVTPTTTYSNSNEFSLTTIEIPISNYLKSRKYSITTDIGSYVLDTLNGKITIVVDEVTVSTGKSLSVTAIDGNSLISNAMVINITVDPVPYISDQALINNDIVNNAALRVNI